MWVKAKIGDARGYDWIEEFEVSSMKTAREEIQDVINHFNETLRPGETERRLIEIISQQEYNLDLLKKNLQKLLQRLTRESNNTYGDLTVKENLPTWKKTIKAFLSLKRPNKSSYKRLYEVLCRIPKDFIDNEILDFVKTKGGV